MSNDDIETVPLAEVHAVFHPLWVNSALKQAEFAKACGISYTTAQRFLVPRSYPNGVPKPTFETALSTFAASGLQDGALTREQMLEVLQRMRLLTPEQTWSALAAAVGMTRARISYYTEERAFVGGVSRLTLYTLLRRFFAATHRLVLVPPAALTPPPGTVHPDKVTPVLFKAERSCRGWAEVSVRSRVTPERLFDWMTVGAPEHQIELALRRFYRVKLHPHEFDDDMLNRGAIYMPDRRRYDWPSQSDIENRRRRNMERLGA